MFNILNLIDIKILLGTEQLNKACNQQASETKKKKNGKTGEKGSKKL